MHNLAQLPAYASVRQSMASVILKWMVESSDLLPYEQDNRFLPIDLEPPRKQ